jgi:hypothetical protein
MTHAAKSAVIALTGFVECALLVYLTLVTWLITAWFIDENAAMRMTDGDWYVLAAERLGGVCLLAATAGGIVYVVNRLVAYTTGHRGSRVPRLSALLFAGLIVLAGVVAAVELVIKKPYF